MKERRKRKAEFEDNEAGELLKVKKKHKVKHNGEVDEKDMHEESKTEKAEKKKMRKEKKNSDQSLSDLTAAKESGKVIDEEVGSKKKKKRKKDKKNSSDDTMDDVSDQKEVGNERKKFEENKGREKSGSTKDLVKLKKKKRKEKRSDEDAGVEESAYKTPKHKEKKKKIKKSDDMGIEENSEEFNRKAEKKKKKQKKQSEKAETENRSSNRSAKKVSFSDRVDVFPLSENSDADEKHQGVETDEDGLVRGKRFSKEEDAIVEKAVRNYIEARDLGEDGVAMVMHCHAHPQIRDCWNVISSSIPWRPRESVYYRAHILFERGTNRKWTPEELERVKWFAEKHGSDWRTLGDEFGKHRIHVKDAWRRIKYPKMKGKWARDEYQNLFDLVNTDLRMKAYEEKKSKHGMLRDNIPWTAISDKLGTRSHALCCMKWYDQLTSPLVAEGLWANSDDYRLLDELLKLDACNIEDVEWDNLLDNRSGDVCQKRWNQMVRHIGQPVLQSFSEQVEILANRYCPDLAEVREEFDNRPRVP